MRKEAKDLKMERNELDSMIISCADGENQKKKKERKQEELW